MVDQTKLMTPADIRNLRIRLGLTQAELGVKLGVASLTVSSWEQGERYPSTQNYMKLLELKNQG